MIKRWVIDVSEYGTLNEIYNIIISQNGFIDVGREAFDNKSFTIGEKITIVFFSNGLFSTPRNFTVVNYLDDNIIRLHLMVIYYNPN